MKIVIINGSARKGNTLTAINAFIKGASEKNDIIYDQREEIEQLKDKVSELNFNQRKLQLSEYHIPPEADE